MTKFVSKGDDVPGPGMCIGYYPCADCKCDHQVFKQEDKGGLNYKGYFSCGNLHRTVVREQIQDERAWPAEI